MNWKETRAAVFLLLLLASAACIHGTSISTATVLAEYPHDPNSFTQGVRPQRGPRSTTHCNTHPLVPERMPTFTVGPDAMHTHATAKAETEALRSRA